MPPEPSVTSACEGPRSCTLRYSSALLPKSSERPGPKSVSPAMYCSGVKLVVRCRWMVDMRPPDLGGMRPFIASNLNYLEFLTRRFRSCKVILLRKRLTRAHSSDVRHPSASV